MYFAYRLLLTLGFFILIPRFLLDALRHGKYVAGFGQRLGGVAPLANDNPVVWLHCVSVGEAQAARPLVRQIRQRFPQHTIVVSTTTLTGQKLAADIFKNDTARVFYFPFDWTWTVRRTLDAIHPALVLIMETEIWPGFFRECHERRIPIAIVNGRLSHRSFRRYKWVRTFMKRVLRNLSFAVMQTEADADRICALGLDSTLVAVSGSVKFDAGIMAGSDSLTIEFRSRFAIDSTTPLIVAASTHEPEESLVLDAFREVHTRFPTTRLILAPRHPERFEEVASLLSESEFGWTARSAHPGAVDNTCDVILLDTIGELSSIYSLAQIVFVGGSIAPTGGHNILEPAAAGAAIITGPHTHNFEAIVRAFVKQHALIQLPAGNFTDSTQVLAKALQELLSKDQLRLQLQQSAKKIVDQNLGATERTLDYLAPLFSSNQNLSSTGTARVAKV